MPTITDYMNYLQKFTPTKINYNHFAIALSVSRSNISHRKNTNSPLSLEEVKKIAKFFKIKIDHNFLNDVLKMDGKLSDTPDNIEIPAEYDKIEMDYYPAAFGSCGSGTFVYSEEKELLQVPRRLVQNYSHFKKYSIVNAIGDSMAPHILDHDKLIVEHFDGGQISDNRIYIFRFLDNLFIKRLVLNLDQIMVISDNDKYPPRTIEHDKFNDLEILGRIVGIFREEK